ncbi:MAG TPA: trypsin-like peptidase domain-containing protein, partial [Symbiobacteriaceae bacterium]|nr:trypsin-like peptidase domain-containing protein [Symbiobacteriaceae bacterium]
LQLSGCTALPVARRQEAVQKDPRGLAASAPGVGIIVETPPAPPAAAVVPEPPKAITAEEVVQKALGTTVFIQTDQGLGSGFFLDSRGTVVTNHHVIEGAKSITVITNDQKKHAVTYIAADAEANDIAILTTAATGYPVLPMLTSGRPQAGATVYAIGNPFGLEWTVSNGIISNPSRTVERVSFIQHTAPISPGNSGGPLILSSGEIVGMNTASVSLEHAQNLNLAVSIQDVDALRADVAAGRAKGTVVGAVPPAAPPSSKQPTSETPAMSPQETAEVMKYVNYLEQEFLPGLDRCEALRPPEDFWKQGKYKEGADQATKTRECYRALGRTLPAQVPARLKKGANDLSSAITTIGAAYNRLSDAYSKAAANDQQGAQESLEIADELASLTGDYIDSAAKEFAPYMK